MEIDWFYMAEIVGIVGIIIAYVVWNHINTKRNVN